jgi:hypothetical protein
MRVCPFCGEPPGSGVFCEACGRNLSTVGRLPTRAELEGAAQGPASGGVSLARFVQAMHAAGDPGAAKVRRKEPGFLGRTRHAEGWVVRPCVRGPDPKAPYERGLFVATDGTLHLLESTLRGIQRDEAHYADVVGPEVPEPADDGRLPGELATVLRRHGLP